MGEVIRLRVASSEEAITLKSMSGSLAVEAVSPRVTLEPVDGGTKMTVTDIDGTQEAIIHDGASEQGHDGFSPSVSVTKSDGVVTISVTDKNGTTSETINDITVDDSMSDSSINPVQNRVVKSAISGVEFSFNETVRMVRNELGDVENDVVRNSADIGLLKSMVSNVETGKQDKLTFDPDPKTGSINPVTSMGIKMAIDSAKALIPTKVSDLTDDSGHYIKPASGIPASDLADGVIPDVSGKQDALTFDTAPTANSTNPVTSGGIYTAIQAKGDPVTVDSELLAESTNPVQNQAIAAEMQDIKDVIFSSGFTLVADPAEWVLGNWYSATGGAGNDSKRIRTTRATQINSLDYYIMADDGVLFFPIFYNGDTYVQREKYPWSSVCSIADAAPVGATGFRLTVRSKPIVDLTDKISETAAKIHFYKAKKVDINQGIANSGKALIVGSDGMVAPGNIPVTDVQVNGSSVVSNGIANVPVATGSTVGIVRANDAMGIAVSQDGGLFINPTTSSEIKTGTEERKPLTPVRQHNAVFYGLAKAAGDSTQSSSSNAVGTYTETAMSKIHEMLDAPVSISGTDPVISGKAGIRYICGTCDTLTLTPPNSGIIDVVFTSGTTPTVLSVPNTVKWANGFNPASLDASATYELNIMNGTMGVACKWT